jgi:hypothetical protein
MKIKLFLLLFVLSFGSSFPWGEEGHKLIAKKAVDILKEKIQNIILYEEYIVENSIEPDRRREHDKSEYPKHFIDIDYYEEFLNGRMIKDKEQLTAIYGDSIVTQMGLLPWTTLETLQNLTAAFREMNRDKVLIFAADLAHYVADAHQPMHTILNYNGQLTDQAGIHRRYESEMLNRYFNELQNNPVIPDVIYVSAPIDYIFSYITNSNSLSELLFAADRFASTRAASTDNDEYYRLFWFRTEYVTKIQFNAAANALASLIYTAWKDAGEPLIAKIN